MSSVTSFSELERGKRDPVFGLRVQRRARIRFEVVPSNGTVIPTADGLGAMRFSKGVHEAIVYVDHLERDDMRSYGRSIRSRTQNDRTRALYAQAVRNYKADFEEWQRQHPGKREKDYGFSSPESHYQRLAKMEGLPRGVPPIAWIEMIEGDLPPPEMTETVTARSHEGLANALIAAVQQAKGDGPSADVAALAARLDALEAKSKGLEAENKRLAAELAEARATAPSTPDLKAADPKTTDAPKGKPGKGGLLG